MVNQWSEVVVCNTGCAPSTLLPLYWQFNTQTDPRLRRTVRLLVRQLASSLAVFFLDAYVLTSTHTHTLSPSSPIWKHHTSLVPNSLAVLFSTTLLSVVNYYCTVSHSPGSYQPEPLSYKAHWENTFIPASRAMSDYLLDLEYVQS